MACNCKKNKLSTQPKRVSKTSTVSASQNTTSNNTPRGTRRIFKRAVR